MTIVSRVVAFLLAWAVLLAALGAAGYALWVGAPWLIGEVSGLYRSATPEFKLGLITAVLSTAGVIWSVMYQRTKEIEAIQFERKREAYSVFFDILFDFMKASDTGLDPLEDPNFKDRFRDLTKRMMIWGSSSTIHAYNKFQSDSSVPSDDVRVTFQRVEQLLRQFRADLGHRDRRLKKFALTKLILKGDEHHQLDG